MRSSRGEPQQPRDTYDAGVCEDGPYLDLVHGTILQFSLKAPEPSVVRSPSGMVTLQQQVEERQKPNLLRGVGKTFAFSGAPGLNGHGHDQEKVEKKPEVASPLPHAAESQKSNGDLQHEEAAEELLNPKEHGASATQRREAAPSGSGIS